MSQPTKDHLTSAFAFLASIPLTIACFAADAAAQASPANQPAPAMTIPSGQAHIVASPKLIIGDAKENRTFYEKVFGMQEVGHYSAKGVYDEPIMGFQGGARLALFQPLAEKPISKSQFPVVLLYTPDLEAVEKRLQDNRYKFQRLSAAQAGTFKIAVAPDPSGNIVEIFHRAGQPAEVGGAKLIVDDRQKAEDFYVRILGAKPGQRYVTEAYDEVIMSLGSGPFIALFQPKAEAPLTKSRFPVVAILTREFDAVLQRVKDAGLGYRDVDMGSSDMRIIVAKDPAGNGVEIIRQAP